MKIENTEKNLLALLFFGYQIYFAYAKKIITLDCQLNSPVGFVVLNGAHYIHYGLVIACANTNDQLFLNPTVLTIYFVV